MLLNVSLSPCPPCPSDNTAGIVTKRSGFRRRLQETYLLPVLIEDNGYPPKSSTGTLTIRVCGCETDGSLLTCSAEAIFLPVGLSTGALIAILLCIVILLGESTVNYQNPRMPCSSNPPLVFLTFDKQLDQNSLTPVTMKVRQF